VDTKPISITLPFSVLQFVDSRKAGARERSLIITRCLSRYEILLSLHYKKLMDQFSNEEWTALIPLLESTGYLYYAVNAPFAYMHSLKGRLEAEIEKGKAQDGIRGLLIRSGQKMPVDNLKLKTYESLLGKLESLTLDQQVIINEVFDELIRRLGESTIRIDEETSPLQTEGPRPNDSKTNLLSKPKKRVVQKRAGRQ
jgi:hypothetical protein